MASNSVIYLNSIIRLPTSKPMYDPCNPLCCYLEICFWTCELAEKRKQIPIVLYVSRAELRDQNLFKLGTLRLFTRGLWRVPAMNPNATSFVPSPPFQRKLVVSTNTNRPLTFEDGPLVWIDCEVSTRVERSAMSLYWVMWFALGRWLGLMRRRTRFLRLRAFSFSNISHAETLFRSQFSLQTGILILWMKRDCTLLSKRKNLRLTSLRGTTVKILSEVLTLLL
jgi:hypothetical protein